MRPSSLQLRLHPLLPLFLMLDSSVGRGGLARAGPLRPIHGLTFGSDWPAGRRHAFAGNLFRAVESSGLEMTSERAEVWGSAWLAATLLGMGTSMIFAPIAYAIAHPGSSAPLLGLIVFGSILEGLGVYVAWNAQRNYERRRRERSAPPPPGFSPNEAASPRP